MLNRCVVILVVLLPFSLQAQEKKIREYHRQFQLSLFPGVSTNGIYSGSYFNRYALNIFGGLSAGNNVLEIGFISNLNLKKSNGIQLAGLANVIGSNAFVNLTLYEERELLKEGFESNFKGIQAAGFLNYVRTHFTGIQLGGAMNNVGFDFRGFQLAGVGNGAGGNSVGIQLAGFYNITKESMSGFQISAFFNYTGERLSGMQLGLLNKAKRIKGKNSSPPTRQTGLQIGLMNFSHFMDGTQIGLINVGGAIRGRQIGLINFFNRLPAKELSHYGTPIGLLNIGSNGSYFRLYYNELFSANVEYTTGNCFNCSWTMDTQMPILDKHKVFNQNALILGYDHFNRNWGFGYGFQKVAYNKWSVAPHAFNEKRVITYGIRFMHLNPSMSFEKQFNLLNRLNIDIGKRWRGKYIFGGISLNYFLQEANDEDVYAVRSLTMSAGKIGGLKSALWPGYNLGVQF